MRKIVFISSSMGRGGAERVMSILTKEYCSNGWDVDIVMLLHNINEYELDARVNVIDLSFENIKNPLVRKIKMLIALRRYLRNGNAQIVVPFLAKIAVITEIALLGVRRTFRVVTSERIDPYEVNYSKLLRVMVNYAFDKADAVVFQTEKAKSYYSKKIQQKSFIIGNPVSIDKIRKIPSDKIIINAGRLESQKNQKMLIEAFALVVCDFPEYELHIYGEGSLRQDLQKQIEALGMENIVFLKGNQSNYIDRLAESEVFVLSSDFEGFSNALLEAMMIGVPCISTDCAGASEILISEENGLVCPVGDAKELAETIRKLLNDKSLQNTVSTNGKKTVQRFKTVNVIDEWKVALEGRCEQENKDLY